MSVISFSVVLFLVAMAAVLALTPAVRGLARRWGAMDRPDGHRKLHAEPIPKLGGVALFIGFYATIGVVLPMSQSATAAAAWELAFNLWQVRGSAGIRTCASRCCRIHSAPNLDRSASLAFL